METNEQKKGYPVLGIILAILGIAAAMFLCLLTGLIGGAVALAFGVAALVLGIFAVKGGKKGGGITSIVLAVIAIILAIVLTMATITSFNEMKRIAVAEETPLMAKYLNSPSLGFIGILLNIPKEDMNDQTAEALRKELDLLSKKMSEITSTAVPAPAQ